MSIDPFARKVVKGRLSDTVRLRTLLFLVAIFAVILSISAGRIRSESRRRSEALRRQVQTAAEERGIVADHYRRVHVSLLVESERIRDRLKRDEAHRSELIRIHGPEEVTRMFAFSKGDPLRSGASHLRDTLARAERFRVMALIVEWAARHPAEPIPPFPPEPQSWKPAVDLEKYIPIGARDHGPRPIPTVVKKAE